MLFNKYLQKIVIIGTSLAFITMSCSKKEEPSPTPTFSYSVNGKSYSTSNAISITNPFSGSSNLSPTSSIPASGGYFGANGSEVESGVTIFALAIGAANVVTTGDTLGIALALASSSSITTGTYTILPISSSERKDASITFADAIFSETSLTSNSGVSASSGTFTITSIDNTKHKVTGTFNFTASYTNSNTNASTTVNVTNGVFTNITFQQF